MMFKTAQHAMSLLTFASVLVGSCTFVIAQERTTRTTFGEFEFAIPEEWVRVDPDREKTGVMLLLNGTAWHDADAMIKIDAGKPAAPTPEALAKALAGKDGKVGPDAVLVDGVQAVKVKINSTDMSRPKVAIVVFRNSKVYLIMGAERHGDVVSKALEDIVKSWKWSELDKSEK